MKGARKIIIIISILLTILQLSAYLGSMNAPSTDAKGIEVVAYYIGFNLPVILASILLIISWFLKIKMQKKEDENLVDSIGQK